jgi:hypothetical protein
MAALVAVGALVWTGCSELSSSVGSASRSVQSTSAPAASSKPTTSASGVYAVTFGVRGSGRLGAVQFDARPGSGQWQGSGAKVACKNLVPPAIHACNDKGGTLSCGFMDTNGIATPADIVTCTLESSKPVSAADFSIKVIDASNTATKPVKADVVVTRVTGR